MSIQRQTETVDTHGDAVKTWVTIADRWAFVAPITGREFFSAQQTQSEVTHRVVLRYWKDHGMTPKDRIMFDGRFLEVLSVLNKHERNREIECMCKERV